MFHLYAPATLHHICALDVKTIEEAGEKARPVTKQLGTDVIISSSPVYTVPPTSERRVFGFSAVPAASTNHL